jgi:hypothetical protein
VEPKEEEEEEEEEAVYARFDLSKISAERLKLFKIVDFV